MHGRLLFLVGLPALVASLTLPVPARAQGTWVETDLGTLGPATTQVRAFAVNDNGVVVGVATSDSIPRPFVWTPESGMTDLGIGGAGTSANGVNNLGQVVGSGLGSRGFLWTPAGGMIDIGPIIPRDINDVGQVAGYFGSHAVIREADGTIIDLGTLGGTYSTAYAINNAGQVVGMSLDASGAARAFLWTAATGMIDLGTLGGLSRRSCGPLPAAWSRCRGYWPPLRSASMTWVASSGGWALPQPPGPPPAAGLR